MASVSVYLTGTAKHKTSSLLKLTYLRCMDVNHWYSQRILEETYQHSKGKVKERLRKQNDLRR